MKNFVSYEKMSKKNKAGVDKQSRREWNFSPITRVKPSAKVYNRKKLKNYV